MRKVRLGGGHCSFVRMQLGATVGICSCNLQLESEHLFHEHEHTSFVSVLPTCVIHEQSLSNHDNGRERERERKIEPGKVLYFVSQYLTL